ncbi:hypothetical protein PENTCL1PPCAC_7749, partial [Pristionchus entomophagus]
PGLITIGRSNVWSGHPERVDLRNLTQIRIGSLMPVRAPSQMWLNDLFSHLPSNITRPEDYEMQAYLPYVMPERILHSSLHERPLREIMLHSTTTKQFLSSKNPLPSLKASHLLKLFIRFCPSSDIAVRVKQQRFK